MTRRRRHDELITLWRAARAEAQEAYEDWCARPGRDAYAAYRAAADRADAAHERLAAHAGARGRGRLQVA